jgi:hypothetical protein
MTDSDDINNPLAVINAVNNPVVSDSDTPKVLFALELTRSGRSWVLGETVNPRYHPPYDGRIEYLQFPASGTRKSDRVVSHQNLACPACAISALRIQASRVARPGAGAPPSRRRSLPIPRNASLNRSPPLSFRLVHLRQTEYLSHRHLQTFSLHRKKSNTFLGGATTDRVVGLQDHVLCCNTTA